MASEALLARNLGGVDGLVALVTGGGTGIGLMIAQTLEANGAAKVYITGRRLDRLEEAAKQSSHGRIIPIQGSTNSRTDLQKAVDFVTADAGFLDLLVCNAGQTSADPNPEPRPIPTPESSIAEIRDYWFNYRPTESWNQVLETNVTAVMTTTMAFLELLDQGNRRRARGLPSSQVIAIGSVAGLARTTPTFIYNASKAAVHHLMKNLSTFLVEHNIRTNVIAPGWFPSEMTAKMVKSLEEKEGAMPHSQVPAERMGNVSEMAGTLLYLASKAGGYTNGAVLVIDGGYLANHAGTY